MLCSSTEVIELTAISCVVGRISLDRGRTWGIINWSKNLVQPSFIEDPELVEEMDSTF